MYEFLLEFTPYLIRGRNDRLGMIRDWHDIAPNKPTRHRDNRWSGPWLKPPGPFSLL
jgi:hypothetical protein